MKIKNYADLAKIAPHCFGCREVPKEEGLLVLAHRNRNGWGMLFGRGIKSLTAAGAIFCDKCHTFGDGEGRCDYWWWEMCTQRTITWAVEKGYIVFNPEGGEPDPRLR